MTLSELIHLFRQKNSLTFEELGQAAGVSKTTASRWESGDIKRLSPENKAKLSQLFDIDVDDYLSNHFFKPVLGEVKAGYDMFASQNILGYEEVTKREADQGDYYLKVKGNSMIGSRIYDGDLIYVQSTHSVENGEIAVVLINGDEATVKKVQRKDELFILEATNPDVENRYFSPLDIAELPVQIIGRVLKVNFKL